MRNPSVVEKLSKTVENTRQGGPQLRAGGVSAQKISSSVLMRGCGFAASARIWTRMLAMVRRFQKATAVAPKRAEPAIRNAVDQRPGLGGGGAVRGTVAMGS